MYLLIVEFGIAFQFPTEFNVYANYTAKKFKIQKIDCILQTYHNYCLIFKRSFSLSGYCWVSWNWTEDNFWLMISINLVMELKLNVNFVVLTTTNYSISYFSEVGFLALLVQIICLLVIAGKSYQNISLIVWRLCTTCKLLEKGKNNSLVYFNIIFLNHLNCLTVLAN